MSDRPGYLSDERLRVPLPCLDDAFALKYGLVGGTGELSRENLEELGRCRFVLTQSLSSEGVSVENVLYDNAEMLKSYSELVEGYFRRWNEVAGALERNRDAISTTVRLTFPWTFVNGSGSTPSDRAVYNFYCVRFETVMVGLLYGICLMNYANVLLREGDENSGFILERAYLVLRDACAREISKWISRREEDLPFEATQDGCGVLMRICLIKIQRNFMASRVATSPGYPEERLICELIVNMFSWSFVQAHDVRCVLRNRSRDSVRDVPEWRSWSDRILYYQIESLGYVFLHSAKCKTYDRRDESAVLLHCAVSSVDNVLANAKKKKTTFKNSILAFVKGGTDGGGEEEEDPVTKSLTVIRTNARDAIPKGFSYSSDGKNRKNPWSLIDSKREMVFSRRELANEFSKPIVE